MLRHVPLDAGSSFDCTQSDLICFDWSSATADFVIPGDSARILRIKFRGDVIVRMLDEFPLSTESDDSKWMGLVPHHFAYRVEGAAFAESQSDAWREMFGPITHFRFITGNGCLDVLAASEPVFTVVSLPC